MSFVWFDLDPIQSNDFHKKDFQIHKKTIFILHASHFIRAILIKL
jgi:hypothetical protein